MEKGTAEQGGWGGIEMLLSLAWSGKYLGKDLTRAYMK